jgi:hypothetical protein
MAGWTDKQITAMHGLYVRKHGTKHPEHGISVEDFRKRLELFESLIDPWITGEGSRESSVRKWCKGSGLSTAAGRGSFNVLFQIVDSIHPVT